MSAAWDVAVFGGSAALAFVLLGAGWLAGALDGETPFALWVAAVVGVDVAHVWATAYRVYLDPDEMRRRASLYLSLPVVAYVCGVLLYTLGSALFWSALAYLAVLHFVRQQYGWLALYRRRLGATSPLDRLLDDAAIYSATLYPLLHWHANLPRSFQWFVAGDFLPGVPREAAHWLLPVHLAITVAYCARQLQLAVAGRPVSPGKSLIVATTWLSWYTGIVVFDSDYAFTVTNVLVHGIPYLAFVWVYERRRWAQAAPAVASPQPRTGAATASPAIARLFRPGRWPLYLAPLLIAAFLEEWGFDRVLWHEHGEIFPGPELLLGRSALALIVPLLAVPQTTHYLLDAWIWRVRPENPHLMKLVAASPSL